MAIAKNKPWKMRISAVWGSEEVTFRQKYTRVRVCVGGGMGTE